MITHFIKKANYRIDYKPHGPGWLLHCYNIFAFREAVNAVALYASQERGREITIYRVDVLNKEISIFYNGDISDKVLDGIDSILLDALGRIEAKCLEDIERLTKHNLYNDFIQEDYPRWVYLPKLPKHNSYVQ